MGWHNAVEQLGRYKELVLATVFVVMAGQELLEVLVLEPVGARLSPGLLLHFGQILVILTGTYVFIKAWQEKTDLMGLELKRSRELARLVGTLQEKEQALARAMERLLVVQEEERRLVAYDIHDCLAQLVVSAKLHLDTFRDLPGACPRAPCPVEREHEECRILSSNSAP